MLIINFEANWFFALKINLGGFNAVPEEPADENLGTVFRRKTAISEGRSIQYYIVVGDGGQKWLDGVAKSNGQAIRFIATLMGFRYSIEAQTTGSDPLGGLQVDVIPLKKECTFHNICKGRRQERFYFSVTHQTKILEIFKSYFARTRKEPKTMRLCLANRIDVYAGLTVGDYKLSEVFLSLYLII